MHNAATLLERAGRLAPDRSAVVLGRARRTYADLDADVDRVANLLRARGVAPGDRIALSCPNLPNFPVVYFGILRAGAVVVPLDADLGRAAIVARLQRSAAVGYFCFEGTPRRPVGERGWAAFAAASRCRFFVLLTDGADSPISGAQPLAAALADQPVGGATAPVDEATPAVLSFPDGAAEPVTYRHATLVDVVGRTHLDLDGRPHDLALGALPFASPAGQALQVLTAAAARQTLVLLPDAEPARVLAETVRENVTVLVGPPTLWWSLLGVPADDLTLAHVRRSLRRAISSGPVGDEIAARFARRFGAPIVISKTWPPGARRT